MQLWLRYAGTIREKCVKLEFSRYHYVTQPNDGKEVRETLSKIGALSDESRKESRNIPRAWVQIQACPQKIYITPGVSPDIQRALGWERCVETSTHPKRAGPRSGGSRVRLPAHAKRTEMSSREKQRDWVKLSALPTRIETSLKGFLDRDELKLREERLELSSPNFLTHFSLLFPKKDPGIRWWRDGAADGLVLGDVFNSARKKPMYCPSAVFKEIQCTEIVPMYYEKHSRRAENDLTGLWLAEDLDSLVWLTLIGWRRIKHSEDWKIDDNVFHGHRKTVSRRSFRSWVRKSMWSGNDHWNQGEGGLVVNISTQWTGSVGSSPSQVRCCVIHPLKSVAVKEVWKSEQNWDADQGASHHLLADVEEMYMWQMENSWPWRQNEKMRRQKESREKVSLPFFATRKRLIFRKTNSCAIDCLLCSFDDNRNSKFFERRRVLR